MTTSQILHKRKPLTAFLLSLPAAGLGQIYCGQLVKGLGLFFLSFAFVPILLAMAMIVGSGKILMITAISSILFRVLVSLYALIDAVVTARRVGLSYTLKEYNKWYVYLLFAVVSMFGSMTIDMDIRDHVVHAFTIPSNSMMPSIFQKEAVLVNKGIYSMKAVETGEVIIFIYPNNRSLYYMKRVVGLPGDTIEMRDNILFKNGKACGYEQETLPDYLADHKLKGDLLREKNEESNYSILLKGTPATTSDFPEITIPNGYCFVLGDNRNNSNDSRHFGPVPLSDVIGRVDFIHLPRKSWKRFGWFSR